MWEGEYWDREGECRNGDRGMRRRILGCGRGGKRGGGL
jgi:hypothetical protein